MARDQNQGLTEQEKAGKHRMVDAKTLFDGRRWRGSMYLAGYAVECLLKAKLMRMFGCRNLGALEEELQRKKLLPSNFTVFTHQLELLLRLTGAAARLRQDQTLWQTFNRVNNWVPAWRYSADLSDEKRALDFKDAVDRILGWIENNV